MERILVKNERGPDLEFDGERVAERAGGSIGAVTVWRTAGGRYVARRYQPAHRGRPYINAVEIFETVEVLGEWLGSSEDAKTICEALGHCRVSWID